MPDRTSPPRAPDPFDSDTRIEYVWREGWLAGYRAALKAVTTEQQVLPL